MYDGIPVPGSPFVVNVEKKQQKKCRVHGPGLEKGVVGKPNKITLTQEGTFSYLLFIKAAWTPRGVES